MEVALHRVPRKMLFLILSKVGLTQRCAPTPPSSACPSIQGKICEPCDSVTRVLVAKVLSKTYHRLFLGDHAGQYGHDWALL